MNVTLRRVFGVLVSIGMSACGTVVAPSDAADVTPPDVVRVDVVAFDVSVDVSVDVHCVPSGPETCDGRDNDCDGVVDNGAQCAGNQVCSAGACTCPPASTCSGTCVDLLSDNTNCGACGNACAVGSTCVGGACGLPSVDLIVMVDNSNSMRENQTNLLAQFGTMLQALTAPPCVSTANPTPHACDSSNPGDHPQYPPVSSLHVGIVSSDLGTPGSSVPGCLNSDLGDDGLLNPIRNGQALSHHEPWTTAPPTFGRPTDCTDPNQFPSFIAFTSGTTPATEFTHDFQCNAGLYVNGCGLESQLESVYRALVIHDAHDTPGNTSPNAGFLRDGALLSIVLLTDEEDGSVRDCRFANGTTCDGQGSIDVYNPASTAWASMELNLRFYMYQPCGPQDPTWPLERYLDPTNPNAGFLALKPGHPERIVFAAIAGVPLNIPMTGSGTTAHINWDGLLGQPGTNPENFCQRDTSALGSQSSAEGPVSMAQANADPNCAQRVVPACRREGSTYSPTACTTDLQYFAWPSRRIVEVARRFDQSPVCHGAACGNGIVASICSNNYVAPMAQIIRRLQARF